MDEELERILRKLSSEEQEIVLASVNNRGELESERDKLRKRFELVHDVARDVTQSLDLDTLIKKVSSAMIEKLSYDSVTLSLVEDLPIGIGIVSHLKAKYHFNQEQTPDEIKNVIDNYVIPLDADGNGVGYQVVKTGDIMYISDTENDRRVNRKIRTKGIGSYVTAPLWNLNQEVIGTISVGKKQKNGFNEELEFQTIEDITTYISVALQNISLKEKSENDLRALSKKFQTIADHSYDLTFLQRPDGSFEYVSPSCKPILGYSPEDFYEGKVNLHSLVLKEDQPLFEKMYDTQHPNQRFSLRMVKKGNQEKNVSLVYKTVISNGVFEGVRGNITDIGRLLGDLLPMCMHCHSIRDDTGVEAGTGPWVDISAYITNNLGSTISHGLCNPCLEKHYKKFKDKIDQQSSP